MPRSRSSSPKRPQSQPTPVADETLVKTSPIIETPVPGLTEETYLTQVNEWLGEPKACSDFWYSGKFYWSHFFGNVDEVLYENGTQSEFTFAKFVVALVKSSLDRHYGAYELQFAVDPIIDPKSEKDRVLRERFWSELPGLVQKHGVEHLSFWFELSERCQTGQSYIRQQGQVYKMETTDPLTPHNNRYFFGHNGVETTLDLNIAHMAKSQQKWRIRDEGKKAEREVSTQSLYALQLATHSVLRTLNETLRAGPVTLPTINGKNPLSEKIAAVAEKAGLKFDVATNTFQ